MVDLGAHTKKKKIMKQTKICKTLEWIAEQKPYNRNVMRNMDGNQNKKLTKQMKKI